MASVKRKIRCVSEQQVLARVENLYAAGIIRRIGPVVDLAKTGYNSTTLVALCVPEDKVDNVALIMRVFT